MKVVPGRGQGAPCTFGASLPAMAKYLFLWTNVQHRWQLAEDADPATVVEYLTGPRRTATGIATRTAPGSGEWFAVPVILNGKRQELWLNRENLTAFAVTEEKEQPAQPTGVHAANRMET